VKIQFEEFGFYVEKNIENCVSFLFFYGKLKQPHIVIGFHSM